MANFLREAFADGPKLPIPPIESARATRERRRKQRKLAAFRNLATALDPAESGSSKARSALHRVRQSVEGRDLFRRELERLRLNGKSRAKRWAQGVAWMDAEEVTRNALGLQALRQVSKLCGDYPEHGTGAAQTHVTINLGLLNTVVAESLKDITPKR